MGSPQVIGKSRTPHKAMIYIYACTSAQVHSCKCIRLSKVNCPFVWALQSIKSIMEDGKTFMFDIVTRRVMSMSRSVKGQGLDALQSSVYIFNELLFCLDVAVGKEVPFEIITAGAGKGQAKVNITGPAGKQVPALTTAKGVEGFNSKFIPLEKGPHSVQVTFNDQPVPRSPFTVTATEVCITT